MRWPRLQVVSDKRHLDPRADLAADGRHGPHRAGLGFGLHAHRMHPAVPVAAAPLPLGLAIEAEDGSLYELGREHGDGAWVSQTPRSAGSG